MLYTSFDENTYNDMQDDERCIQFYIEKVENIKLLKNNLWIRC